MAVTMPPRRPAPSGTSAPALRLVRPGIFDLAAAARAIGAETTFEGAARLIEREALRLTGAAEAQCVAFDWVHRRAWSWRGEITTGSVVELVADVAGRGRRTLIGSALVEPIGPAPSRAVIALRRRSGTFPPAELGALAGLVAGVTQTLERLLGTPAGDAVNLDNLLDEISRRSEPKLV